MKVFYGYGNYFVEVTQTLVKKPYIPIGDIERATLFDIDPVPGVEKVVLIYWTETHVQEYSANFEIHLRNNEVEVNLQGNTLNDTLELVHRTLNFVGGSLQDEYQEQLMALQFIGPRRLRTRGILEIGGNIGRNSTVIASLLGKENEHKLVVVESNPHIAEILDHNRRINNMEFHVEALAISKTPLIQNGWNTKASTLQSDIEIGWNKIETQCWKDFNAKYKNSGIIFDTLVADCEGALYYILKEEPMFLENISLVLIENDFSDKSHKEFVDSEFIRNGLECVYKQKGGWGPCENCFYEAWLKF